MSLGQENSVFYFNSKGPANTDKTLDIALGCCRERKIQQVEIAIMAAEAGTITPGRDVVAIAGSHRGGDTAVVLTPAYAADMFATRIRALLCMPS